MPRTQSPEFSTGHHTHGCNPTHGSVTYIRTTMNTHEHATEIGTGLIKLAPPIYVAGTSIMGVIDWQLWVYVLTFIYLLMQMGQFVWEKWIKPNVKRRK